MSALKVIGFGLGTLAIGTGVYMYFVKKDSAGFTAYQKMNQKANQTSAGADGKKTMMTQKNNNMGGRRYPPHTFIGNLGKWTDWQGKPI